MLHNVTGRLGLWLDGAVLAQADEPAGEVQQEVEAARSQAEEWWQGFTDALPRLGIALAVVAVAWILARLTRAVLRPRLARRRTPSFGAVMSKLAGYMVLALGVVAGLTIAFPSVQPVDMLAGLGVVSIAAGFAFQDILSNLLAGLLLIFRQPFVSGDQVEVNGIRGTVQGITIRETEVKTFDGRRILIPNKDVYQNAIEIQTADPAIRSSLVVGCSYDDDIRKAAGVALDALRGTDGVVDDPPPEALFTEFADSSINLDLRYWTDPRQAELRRVQSEVVMSVKSAFDEAGLDIPFPLRTLDATPGFRETFGRYGSDPTDTPDPPVADPPDR
jgi:small conductance mechanosensitive channel